jgi:hypothetical protein
MNPKRLPRPSAYLWARCEGWAKIGVCHGVIVDGERDEVLDEKRNVLLRGGADGLWVEPGKEEGMRYDHFAVTHLPLNPDVMARDGWRETWAARQESYEDRAETNAKRLGEKTMGSRKTKPPETGDTQGEFFDENPGKEEPKP